MNENDSDFKAFIKAVSLLARQDGSKKNVKYSVMNGIITTSCASVGLFFGPVGLAVGAGVGAGIAASLSHGKYKSMIQIVHKLEPNEKILVYRALLYALKKATTAGQIGLILQQASNGNPEALKLVGSLLMEAYNLYREEEQNI